MSTKMKALSLTAPYGTLIALGAKHIETRSWATSYRGPLAIHQAKGLGPVGEMSGLEALCDSEPFFRTFVTHGLAKRYSNPDEIVQQLPRGAIVAVCRVASIYRITEHGIEGFNPQPPANEIAFGDYSAGRYAWVLADVYALPEPIATRGYQGLWDWQPPEGFTV